MTNEIRKELNNATRLYKAKKRQEAYEIFDRLFRQNPEEFRKWDRIRYCWSIYHMHIRDSFDEEELSEYGEMVTDIVEQEDLNEATLCVYTQCVFKIIRFYKSDNDWYSVLYWLDKLDPNLLDDKKGRKGDMIYPSRKEEYYNLKSKALLKCDEYKQCIQASVTALQTISEFALDDWVWHKFRIAKSLRQLDEPEAALLFLEDVLNVQDQWFVYRELAENYYALEDYDNALKSVSLGILSENILRGKENLYHLAYNILKDSDQEFALKHAEMFVALKLETESDIPIEMDDLGIDEDNLNIKDLEQEIKNKWIDYDLIGAC